MSHCSDLSCWNINKWIWKALEACWEIYEFHVGQEQRMWLEETDCVFTDGYSSAWEAFWRPQACSCVLMASFWIWFTIRDGDGFSKTTWSNFIGSLFHVKLFWIDFYKLHARKLLAVCSWVIFAFQNATIYLYWFTTCIHVCQPVFNQPT